jgi:hypothetical protein
MEDLSAGAGLWTSDLRSPLCHQHQTAVYLVENLVCNADELELAEDDGWPS